MNEQTSTSLLNRSYLILFFINMVASMSYSMVSATMTLHLMDIGFTTAMAGMLIGALSVAAMIVRPFSGLLSDAIQRKRLLQLSLSGILLAMAGYSLSRNVWLILTLRVLHGVAFSLATTVTMAMVAGCMPSKKRSTGMGMFALGQTITMAIAPSLGLWIGARYSYSATFYLAVFFVGFALLMTGLIKPSPEGDPQKRKGLSLRNMFAREALLYAMVAMAISAATGVENSFVAAYGLALGAGNVGWYFTISAAVLFLSRTLVSWLSDRFGLKVIVYPGLAVIAIAFVLMSRATPESVTTVFALSAALKALGLGAIQPALQAASVSSVTPERRGAASGTYYLGTDIGQSMAPLLGGMIVQQAGYPSLFLIFIMPILAVGIIFALTYRTEGENHYV